MANFNSVVLVGNVVRDPVVKELNNGVSVANLTLAINEFYIDRNKEKQKETVYVDVEVFGTKAKTIEQYVTTGKNLMITGRLRQNKWEDKTTHKNMSRLVVRADNFQFLGKREDSAPEDETVDEKEPTTEPVKKTTRKKVPF